MSNIKSKGNYNIEIDEYIPEKVVKIIMAVHGFGGDKKSTVITTLASELNQYNIGVVSFDFAGHGESPVEGNFFTVESSINDLNCVEEYVKKKYNVPVGIFATSYGAYITLLNLGKNNKKYVNAILRCPAINMYEIFKNNILNISIEEFREKGYCELGYERKIDITYKYFEELKNNNINEAVKQINTSLVIIHGTEDDMAPIKDSIEFQQKFQENVILEKVYGADHRFKKEGELEKIIDIVKKYVLI